MKYRVVSKRVRTRKLAASDFRPNTQSYVESFVTSWQSLNYSKKSAPLRNARIHHRANNSLALDPVLNPVRIPTYNFNIIPFQRPVHTNDNFTPNLLTKTPHSSSSWTLQSTNCCKNGSLVRITAPPGLFRSFNFLYNSWPQTLPPRSLNYSKQQGNNSCSRPRRP
jgi:hypothetical protein